MLMAATPPKLEYVYVNPRDCLSSEFPLTSLLLSSNHNLPSAAIASHRVTKRENIRSMSFQDIEAGRGHQSRQPSSLMPQSREDNAFQSLQSSLSLQVFKTNANVQGILKLVDQLGTGKDSAALRKSLCVEALHSLTRS